MGQYDQIVNEQPQISVFSQENDELQESMLWIGKQIVEITK